LNDVVKGKYRLVREIARSNDIVYEAVDTNLGRRIALKELNIAPSLTGQARRERIERFNREARAAGRLSHPNIVAVFDFGEENGRHFIAMEYLDGQTLRDLMQMRGALPLKDALDIASALLDALAYAHTNKVIHRDIKPDNIFILTGGQVKLADFGIARLTEEPSLTSNGQVFGTPSYMSPEQIEGRAIDHRSDLFSVGVLLYEMLTGRKPFVGDSVVSITYAVMNAEPPPMTGVPMGIEQVIRRALAKNPNQRQMSADQMRTDLRNAEQTPALFFPPQSTYMGQMGPGGGGAGTNYPGAGTAYPSAQGSSGGYGAPPNIGTGYGAPQPGYAPSQQTGSNGLPWVFNTPGQTNLPTPSAQQMPAPLPYGAPAPGSGAYPYGMPAPRRPRKPLITLSPEARTTLYAILGAIVLGTVIAFAVIMFMRSYDTYKASVGSEQVIELIRRADAAYNQKDFSGAVKLLGEALAAKPSDIDRAKINTELGYAYVCLARAARDGNRLTEAQKLYEKALSYSPDYKVAHSELGALKGILGDTNGASVERSAAASSGNTTDAPGHLDSSTLVPSSGATGGADPQQFLNDRSQQAQQLISEGDALDRQGLHDQARSKWQEAETTGAGLPEHDLAKQRLDSTDPAGPSFGGGGGSDS